MSTYSEVPFDDEPAPALAVKDGMLAKLEAARDDLLTILEALPTYPYTDPHTRGASLRDAYASGKIHEAVRSAHESVGNARIVLNVYGEHIE